MDGRTRVVIGITCVDGDIPVKRNDLAYWLANQVYNLDRKGTLFDGLDDKRSENTALSVWVEEG